MRKTTAILALLLLLLLSGCAAEVADVSATRSIAAVSSVQSSTAEQVINEDKNIRIARELLTETDEIKKRMTYGMALLYTGEHQTIDGRDCLIFALGTDHEGQFVREYLYGVCDNLIYAYDALTDKWTALGAG